jgi:hypothetical protein
MNVVTSNSTRFAVRVADVSRISFNAVGQPMATVNQVTLVVRENSMFEFISANGPRTMPLNEVITSLLPRPEARFILTESISVRCMISIFPQFNWHVSNGMTREHFGWTDC